MANNIQLITPTCGYIGGPATVDGAHAWQVGKAKDGWSSGTKLSGCVSYMYVYMTIDNWDYTNQSITATLDFYLENASSTTDINLSTYGLLKRSGFMIASASNTSLGQCMTTGVNLGKKEQLWSIQKTFSMSNGNYSRSGVSDITIGNKTYTNCEWCEFNFKAQLYSSSGSWLDGYGSTSNARQFKLAKLAPKGFVMIGNGTGFDAYSPYIRITVDGTDTWVKHQPYVYDADAAEWKPIG